MSKRVDALANHHPIEPPPTDIKPVGGAETDLPWGDDGRPGAAHVDLPLARARLRSEQRSLELGGEEAEARRHAVRAWLDQELGQGLADELQWCRRYEAEAARRRIRSGRRRELPEHLDPHDLSEAGWGILLPDKARPELSKALQPLLAERSRLAGPRFKVLTYCKGDSARGLLENRLGQAPGVLDPGKAPYYLLIAGSPEEIPFEVQYQLGIGHAVGRLHFDDLAGYRRYAAAVVQAERSRPVGPRRFTLFAVEHEGDPATQRLRAHLVDPLAERLAGVAPWQVDVWGAERASKADLARLLGGDATPAVLLAACHGQRVPFGAPDQEDLQGALVCQDRPAAKSGCDHCFTAEDLRAGYGLHRLIVFLLACYGAGTPMGDSFEARRILAPRPFLAALPQALLSRGALAVLGHVDRGWTLSFSWLLEGRIQAAAATFEEVLRRLLVGHRLGHALRPLHRRYAALAAHAAPSVERLLAGGEANLPELELLHVAINDARNFILLGDPAVYATGRRLAR